MEPFIVYTYLAIIWKEANIDPLPIAKMDTPFEFTEIRGINVTPVIARCFERYVYRNFSKSTFDDHMCSNQYGYRTGCTCTDALIHMQYNCLKSLDDNNCSCVRLFAMDFSKAFDNVKYSLLGDKLKYLPLDPFIFN